MNFNLIVAILIIALILWGGISIKRKLIISLYFDTDLHNEELLKFLESKHLKLIKKRFLNKEERSKNPFLKIKRTRWEKFSKHFVYYLVIAYSETESKPKIFFIEIQNYTELFIFFKRDVLFYENKDEELYQTIHDELYPKEHLVTNQCPACGFNVKETDLSCPDCELNFS